MECQATMHLESDGESDFEAVQALESWHPFTKENPYVDGPTQMRDGVVSQASHPAGLPGPSSGEGLATRWMHGDPKYQEHFEDSQAPFPSEEDEEAEVQVLLHVDDTAPFEEMPCMGSFENVADTVPHVVQESAWPTPPVDPLCAGVEARVWLDILS